jgi:hypothetical protein
MQVLVGKVIKSRGSVGRVSPNVTPAVLGLICNLSLLYKQLKILVFLESLDRKRQIKLLFNVVV